MRIEIYDYIPHTPHDPPAFQSEGVPRVHDRIVLETKPDRDDETWVWVADLEWRLDRVRGELVPRIYVTQEAT